MATLTDSFATFDAAGNAEDFSDVIYNVDPYDTPLMSKFARTKANAILHQWQIDSYAAASSTNQVIEGSDVTRDAATATTVLSNTCEISDKVPSVTGTQEAVRHYGRTSEMAYQIAKRSVELKRDMESAISANKAEDATGESTDARELGGIPAWITTSTDNGSGGSDGSVGNSARTDGTQRPFDENLLQTVLQAIWEQGGNPDCIFVGGFNKRAMSTFAGNATRMKTAEDRTLQAAIDLYESDFGDHEIVLSRFSRARDCLILQTDMWALAYLRPFTLTDIAKTGDAETKQLLVEYTLESRNEAASGAVWDLTTS